MKSCFPLNQLSCCSIGYLQCCCICCKTQNSQKEKKNEETRGAFSLGLGRRLGAAPPPGRLSRGRMLFLVGDGQEGLREGPDPSWENGLSTYLYIFIQPLLFDLLSAAEQF
jgi:hypothetical protein